MFSRGDLNTYKKPTQITLPQNNHHKRDGQEMRTSYDAGGGLHRHYNVCDSLQSVQMWE